MKFFSFLSSDLMGEGEGPYNCAQKFWKGIILFWGKCDAYDSLIKEQHLSQQGQTNWQEENTKLTFYGWEQQTH